MKLCKNGNLSKQEDEMMIKKKAILTVAAAAALMMSNPVLNKAHAATTNPSVQEKVYVYQGTNMDEINSVIEKYLASLGFSFSPSTVKQPVQTQQNQTVPTQQPVQTQQNQTVPAQQPAQTPA